MVSHFPIGLTALLFLHLAGVSWACQEPPKGVYFARENLEDDIVLTIVSESPDDDSHWSVKGLIGDPAISDLADSFTMRRKGPLWNLVVTKGIFIPESKRSGPIFPIRMELECIDPLKHHASYHVKVSVLPETLLEKIPIVVPENTPVQEVIYYDKAGKKSKVPILYGYRALPGMDDASDYLDLNPKTGTVSLKKPLDYERDPIVMWFLTTKMSTLRLFRIEIGNVNDNAPQFFLNEKCLEVPRCLVDSYNFTLDKEGDLIPQKMNRIRAQDFDGEAIEYSIIEAVPHQNFITINPKTGQLGVNRPKKDIAPKYILYVQASDGVHKTKVVVTIDVEKVELVDLILDQLGFRMPQPIAAKEKSLVTVNTSSVVPTTLVTDDKDTTTSKTIFQPLEAMSSSLTRNFLKNLLNGLEKSATNISSDWDNIMVKINHTILDANSTGLNSTNETMELQFSEEEIHLLKLCANVSFILEKNNMTNANVTLVSRNGTAILIEEAAKLCPRPAAGNGTMEVVEGVEAYDGMVSGASLRFVDNVLAFITTGLCFLLCYQV